MSLKSSLIGLALNTPDALQALISKDSFAKSLADAAKESPEKAKSFLAHFYQTKAQSLAQFRDALIEHGFSRAEAIAIIAGSNAPF